MWRKAILLYMRKKQVNKKFFFQQNILIFAVLPNIYCINLCNRCLEENHQKKFQKNYW
jgi:hypothetical protein